MILYMMGNGYLCPKLIWEFIGVNSDSQIILEETCPIRDIRISWRKYNTETKSRSMVAEFGEMWEGLIIQRHSKKILRMMEFF